jgi:EAL domain-containing protein (putative c-di-GMP-specific phosphodiesterase class I)
MIGAEALLRWRHLDMGEIPPGIFIPIAVRNGLIDSIGRLVVHYACSFVDKNRAVLEETSDIIPISVNASFIELINPNFSQRFLEVMNKFHLSPELIRIEVTESEISMHYGELEENLRQLHMAGIGVELDDFGTGYSSLSHLGNMPVQTIKIDKVFVDNILIDNKIGDLVEMIIDFAHRFKMRIIAEGVETVEQFLWLKEHNCDAYQGYYFAKPLKEEMFLDKIQDSRRKS